MTGFVDDLNGWDFYNNDQTVFDSAEIDEHGTHVAGTIGAVGNNGQGVVGINWHVKIMPLKFLGSSSGDGPTSAAISAINYARQMAARGVNIRVVNSSWGSGNRSQALLDAITTLNAAGILFVAAAGNDGTDNFSFPHYPSNYDLPNIISVAATNRVDSISGFSNFSARTVTLGAPGSNILSTTPNNTYTLISGTSMATPHVSGAAALILAAKPDTSLQGLSGSLSYGGDVIPALQGKTRTGRRLNVYKSILSAQENDTSPPSVPYGFSATPIGGRAISLAWVAPGDDATSGTAANYDIFFTGSAQVAERLVLPSQIMPAGSGTQQSVTVVVPYRNTSGTITLRTYDNVGNFSDAIATVNLPLDSNTDPFLIAFGAGGGLSTGGDKLLNTDNSTIFQGDDRYTYYSLPFAFPYFGQHRTRLTVSTNGTIYFSTPATFSNDDAADFNSSLAGLRGQTMIAGMWDDLVIDTTARPNDGVYIVRPNSNSVILRWQGATLNGSLPINFEVELRTDGAIISRYGEGNTGLFPVVGISGGEPDSYSVDSHTSETVSKTLTNAPSVTFSPRGGSIPTPTPTPTPTPANADLRLYGLQSAPEPVMSGQQLLLSASLINLGPGAASNVRISINLPAGTSFVSCSASIGPCVGPGVGYGGTVTADFDNINNQATASLSVFAQVTAAGDSALSSTASITSSTIDPNTANNFAVATVHVIDFIPFSGVNRISLNAEGAHVLALRNGTVWAWGHNYYGQLGDGTNTNRNVPQQVENLMFVKAVAAGMHHSVALKYDGTVWAWGSNEHGQLGTGPGEAANSTVPIQVQGLSSITDIAAGASHTLALKSDGTVWVWGSNSTGELGLGTHDLGKHPVPLRIPLLSRIHMIAAGSHYSLAVNQIDGIAWSWGSNSSGQLGDGTTNNRESPAQVSELRDVRTLAAGMSHVVAIKKDNSVWSWGSNFKGQLGLGTSDNDPHPLPAQVGNLRAAAVSAGYANTLISEFGPGLRVCGANDSGQLGLGSSDSDPHPNPTVVPGLSSGLAIVSGGGSSFVVNGGDQYVGGTARAWGRNQFGVLGTGSEAPSYSATTVRDNANVAKPILTSSNGSFFSPTDVFIGCGTPLAELHYTTNGQDPTQADPMPFGSVRVERPLTLKVKAWRNGFAPSPVASANFTIEALPVNPIDDARNFIRQHYLDFLGREPDEGGWNYWTSQFTACGADTACIHRRRIDVSAAFFVELEFQRTGYVVYRLYRAAHGTIPNTTTRANVSYAQFNADRGQLTEGAELQQSTINLANAFVGRPEFLQAYPNSLSNAPFVNKLFDTAQLVPYTTERQQQIDAMNNSGETRAQVLLDVIEISEFKTREYNPAFVLMQYFGYLRRDPDQSGYDFWLDILNNRVPNNFRGMVCAFLTSAEYQQRFGSTVSRTDRDCAQL